MEPTTFFAMLTSLFWPVFNKKSRFPLKDWAFSFFLGVWMKVSIYLGKSNSAVHIVILSFCLQRMKWKSRDFQPSYRVWSAPLPWQTFRCSAGKCKVWVPNGLPWCVCPSSFALGTPCDKTCTFSAPRLRAASSAGRRTSSEESVHKSDTWPSWDRFQSERSCVPSTSCHSEMEEQYYSTSFSIVGPYISIN